MNLHDVFAPLAGWMWVTANGMNGHHLGTHLYYFEDPGPPPFEYPGAQQNWQYRHPMPARFNWRPFSNALPNLRQRYIDNRANARPRPLCGWTTRSAAPRFYESWRGHCGECITLAAQRGIIALRTDNYAHPLRDTVLAERQAWIEAGHPEQWPLPPQT